MPPVADPDRPLERGPGVAADPDRDVPCGLGLGADVLEAGAVDGELGGDVIVGPHPPDHLDGFVGASSALVEGHAEGVELGFEPPRSCAEDHPPTAELVDGGDRLGDHDGAAHRRTSTVVPMRTREVAAATQVITANGSRTYADGGYGTPAGTTRWSLTHTSAKPRSSASRAVRVRASPDAAGPACGRWTPPVIDVAAVIAAPYRDPGRGVRWGGRRSSRRWTPS